VYIEAVPQLVRVRCKACHALPCEDRQPPPPQPRKINCTFATAPAQKFARWAAMCYAGFASKSLLKVRLRRKDSHASNSATPHPQLRKINCTLQNALVEKAAWWAAMCYAGYATHSNSAASLSHRHSAKKNQL